MGFPFKKYFVKGMAWLLANYGPVTVVIWATDPFTSYQSGVYYEDYCPTDQVNHAVVSYALCNRSMIATKF